MVDKYKIIFLIVFKTLLDYKPKSNSKSNLWTVLAHIGLDSIK